MNQQIGTMLVVTLLVGMLLGGAIAICIEQRRKRYAAVAHLDPAAEVAAARLQHALDRAIWNRSMGPLTADQINSLSEALACIDDAMQDLVHDSVLYRELDVVHRRIDGLIGAAIAAPQEKGRPPDKRPPLLVVYCDRCMRNNWHSSSFDDTATECPHCHVKLERVHVNSLDDLP